MKNDKKLSQILYLLIPFSFFLFFAFFDGYVLCDDSSSYINMEPYREPLYPLLLSLFRSIVGKEYLLGIVVLQSLLAAYATYSLSSYISSEYKLNTILKYLVLFIILSVSLLCRFAAKRSSMYSNSILSEGIAYPLFLLFFKRILDYLLNGNYSSLGITCLLSFLMMSARKQMYFSLALIVIVIIYKLIENTEILKGIFCVVISIVMIVGGTKLFDYIYTTNTNSINATHTSDNRFLTTMLFYVSEKEDAQYISNQDSKELFIRIYDKCDKEGYLKHSSGGKWFDRVQHFSNHYDNIQIDTMWPEMRQYASEKLGVNETNGQVELLVDKYNNDIISSLLSKKIGLLLSTFIDNFLCGLMITVSAEKSIFIIYSLVIYIAYIALLIYSIVKNGLTKYSKLGLLIMFSILTNVGITSLVIFNQTRYTIYNMALFYITGLILLTNTFKRSS